MATIQRKNLDAPDEVRRFPRGQGELTQVGRFDARGQHTAKGFDEPLELYRLRP